MDASQLLAVIEVPYEDRARCSAPGCGHSVYKRVHILRIDGALQVYGSTCFAREFAGQAIRSTQPHFTSASGRVLTAEERELLVANTEQLIARFDAERTAALERQGADEHITAVMRRTPICVTAPNLIGAPNRSIKQSRERFTPQERAAVEPEALKILQAKLPGLDFYSPGFNGLLQSEIDRILRERAIEKLV